MIDTLSIDGREYAAFIEYREMRAKWENPQSNCDDTVDGIAMILERFGASTEVFQLFAAFLY